MKKKAVVWVGGHASDAMRRPLSPAGRGGPVAGTSFFFFFLRVVAGTSYSRLRGGEEEHRRPLAIGDGPYLGRLA